MDAISEAFLSYLREGLSVVVLLSIYEGFWIFPDQMPKALATGQLITFSRHRIYLRLPWGNMRPTSWGIADN